MANVVIDIASEFTGKKAFKQADSSVEKLNAKTKNLGKTLTRTFGTAAVVAFGRASVKAFAEDNKAATSLGQTLKNLNLAYGSNIGTVNGFISRLEMQTGVLDDELRPAMDRLLRATGSVTKSQELLGLALDIAAGTGRSVTQVSQSLQKAYLGQTQALGRLGVGLSKAELASGSFEEIQQKLTTLFAGQAVAAADTFAGSLDKLTIAANNAKETIGKGLYDAITALGGGGTTSATENIDKLAQGIADSLKNTGEFISRLEKFKPVLIAFGIAAAAAFFPLTTAIAGAILLMSSLNKELDKMSFRKGIIPGGMGNVSMTVSSQDTQRADNAAARRSAAAIAKSAKEQAAAQAKITKDKKLAALIDKAQLKIVKGTDVFDIEKVQIAAALTNQAEQLGKATNTAQVLQIANDTARLNVKKSILDVEDAIASKDTEAIENALKKLDGDLKVLAVLNNQKLTLGEISTLLKSLQAADIKGTIQYTDNITETIKRLQELYKIQMDAENALLALKLKNARDIASFENDTLDRKLRGYSASAMALAKLSGVEREAAVAKLASDIGTASFIQGITAGLSPADAASGARYAAQAAATYYINITAGIGDPNAIAEEVDKILKDAQNRGTLVGGLTIA
jgi:hypothetical protein